MYYKAIVIVLIGCIALLSQAMESIIPSIEIKNSNTIISSVAFLGNNAVVVVGDKGCQIFAKNKLNCYEQKQSLSTEPIVDMSLSFDGKKLACATHKKVILYNVLSDKIEQCYSKEANDLSRISCSNSSLFAFFEYKKLMIYDYNTKKCQEHNLQEKHLCKHKFRFDISCNSTKNEIVIIGLNNRASLINVDDGKCTIVKNFSFSGNCLSCAYNFDNSMVVFYVYGKEGYQCMNSTKDDEPFIFGNHNKQYKNFELDSIAFHKDNAMVALVNKDENVVEFWQYKKLKQLASISLIKKPISLTDQCFFGNLWLIGSRRRLAFSADGYKFVVAVNDQCFVYNTPIDAICPQGVKEYEYIINLIFYLNCIFDCYSSINKDVQRIIVENVLELRRISNNVLVHNKTNDISIKKVSAEVDYRAPSTVDKPIEKAKVLHQARYKNLWDDAIKSEKWTTIAIVARKICVMRWWHSLSRFKQSIVSLSIMVPLVYFMKILCHKLIRRYVFIPVL